MPHWGWSILVLIMAGLARGEAVVPAYVAPAGTYPDATLSSPYSDPALNEPALSEPAAMGPILDASYASTARANVAEGTVPESPLDVDTLIQPGRIVGTLKTMGLLSIVSLAPAVLLMTTSYVRVSIVLGLLRQGIGTHNLPSNQVVTSLSLFLTLLIMTPVWKRVYDEAIVPYTDSSSGMTWEEAWDAGVAPVREFMSQQIEASGNGADVRMLYAYAEPEEMEPATYEAVPLQVLLPAFLLSELKTAFLIGFQIFLPFLMLDMIVSTVTVSMGMIMMPPVVIALPFKLLLFVLVDGWHLVVGMLLQSFV
jgi:flagellar biosynthetic protein FliP